MDTIADIIVRIINTISNPELFQNFVNNRFCLIVLVILLMRMKYATYRSLWLSALINIPGTILHEFMHFVIGYVFNAMPTSFTVFPKKDLTGNYVMGSVGFKNITYYNAIPASMAPLLLLPLGFYLNRHFLPTLNPNFFNYILYVLMQTIIIENAIPSRQDFRIAFRHLHGILIYGTLLVALLLF